MRDWNYMLGWFEHDLSNLEARSQQQTPVSMHRAPTTGQNNMIKTEVQKIIAALGTQVLKDLYSCPVEIINCW